MKIRTPVLLLVAILLCFARPVDSIQRPDESSVQPSVVADVPMPAKVLGFAPGDDRKLASWSQVLEYFEQLDRASDRLVFETLGQTSMGKPFVMATISSPENLDRKSVV